MYKKCTFQLQQCNLSTVSQNASPTCKRGKLKKNGFGGQISKAEGGQILVGYHVFLQKCYFCGNIVIIYSCHYACSKMVLENDSTILNLCCIRFLSGHPPLCVTFFICSSVHPSIVHHVSGTIHHLIIIFDTHL